MRQAKHVARMVKNMSAYRVLAGNLQGRDRVAEVRLEG